VLKNLLILLALVTIVALPFIFRQEPPAGEWRQGDPVLVIVSPHNEAIRYEFANAFSRWHQGKFGRPARIDWRSIGGTTEIVRYLSAEYTTSMRGWWERQGKPWPAGATDTVTASRAPTDPDLLEIYNAVRKVDDAGQITCGIDVFFGGGQYDHNDIYHRGMTVIPWPAGQEPAGLFAADGVELIPAAVSGEIWRDKTYFGCVVSTFGICYNHDRLREAGITTPPTRWDDLADVRYFRQVGAADPTKSGSVAKAFEMMIHQKVHDRVTAAGFTEADIDHFENAIAEKKWAPGQPAGEFGRIEVYQRCVESGWVDGIRLVQKIGANARYFTDSASKVPIDVSIGDAAVGMSIDFYARFQVQESTGPRGEARMTYITPVGGSSVSCDPLGLLRGAPNREIAVRFIEFCLSEEGQRLWCYKPAAPGGPEKFALRRLPIRRDFYPSTRPAVQAKHEQHAKYSVDDLADPTVDPYALAQNFIYRPRWTARHFGVQRDLIRAMCLDSADELRDAWTAIRDAGGPEKVPQAMAKLGEMPTVMLRHITTGEAKLVSLDWATAPTISGRNYRTMDYMREWTNAFRANYRAAADLARQGK
jgi:iron(III) transport system substrate-binding protein